MKQLFSLFFYLLLFNSDRIYAQMADSTISGMEKKTISLFRTKIAEAQGLYNGVEEPGYSKDTVGNPYFFFNHLEPGSVGYDGIRYENIPMMYDLTRESLIIKYLGAPIWIRLLNSKLDSFTLAGHHFIKITAKDSIPSLKEGLYDRLYSGSASLLARRYASFQQVIVDDRVKNRVDSKVAYYIVRDKTAYPVSSAKSALRLMSDKGEIRSYLRKNKVRFRKDKEKYLKTVVSYQDTRHSPI